MSTPRPNFIDLRSQSQTSISRPLKSPRLHVAGEAPPELSPLDAFALQSRLLARQLEESAKAGRRVSRLPPLTTSSPLVLQGRSDYFRSMSSDSYSDNENEESPTNHPPLQKPSAPSRSASPTGFSNKTPEVEEPLVRPQSMHPRMSRVPPVCGDNGGPPPVPAYARERQRLLQTIHGSDEEDANIFGARRERSPSPLADGVFETQLRREVETIPASTKSYSDDATQRTNETQEPRQQPQEPQGARELPETQEPRELDKPHDRQQRQPSPEPQQHLQFQQFQQTQPSQPLHRPQNQQQQQQQPHSFTNQAHPSPHPGLGRFTQSPERVLGQKNSFDLASGGLAPPRPLFTKRSSSILSSPLETTDEDGHSAMGASFHSLNAPRKLSTSSGMVSPGFGSFQRSPSFGSDMSAPLPRPSFNFSRPLSRVGTPGLESPARQASSDSHTSYSQSSFVLADDTASTPISMHSEGFPDPSYSGSLPDDGRPAAPSYIYSKFTLPRGKSLQRPSPSSSDHQFQSSHQSEQPSAPPSNTVQTLPHGGQAPPSPPTRPSSSSGAFTRPSMERTKLSTEILGPASQPSPDPSRPSTDGSRSLEEPRGRTLLPTAPDSQSRAKTPMSVATATSGATSDSTSTIKPRSMHSLASAADVPAHEHVDQAIALHEKGLLSESTYHLRHAARQGHPTGMLLYALACRHGWGIRANPREGAEWLRKAADCASLEIADDEALIKEGKNVDVLERKTRKAQFALSIYELGVSYMNGWGIEQDKPLALRCFEIAGSWGDIDALAEAGFCYAQGIGCKKNLKRSATFYRQAEAKGMSMVGNSWIHKSKYNDDKESIKSSKSNKEQKARSKSRSRNIFGLKHHS
ncbi:cell cycle inhibitor protein [Niveomyces insectorum RCEF 264]|uniref:Cell cycle inhibitor protein n=1 Tax=Niveomyces insectorum RCEF 264 TaxID=1081102 RepID=A0A167VGM4_9HYPO|nr:cell cycle inhibitor protein [Niveomyces insectorum RCEF 264]